MAVVRGKVFTGLGEGASYVSLPFYREAFRRVLGFDPYPGTLNLKVEPDCAETVRALRNKGLLIPRRVVDGVEYGWVRCLPARIRGIEAAVLIIEKTVHGPDVIEVIAPVRLRDALGLKDGDVVEVEVLVR